MPWAASMRSPRSRRTRASFARCTRGKKPCCRPRSKGRAPPFRTSSSTKTAPRPTFPSTISRKRRRASRPWPWGSRSRDPNGLPISTRLLCDMHRVLLGTIRGSTKRPGEVRCSQNWIGGSRPGNATFVPPPAERVPELLSDLERYINRRANPLVKAALAHIQFETIHPFLDGNGRIGRQLITLMLCDDGLLSEPLLYVSLYLKEHRSTYYELLSRWSVRPAPGRTGPCSSAMRSPSPREGQSQPSTRSAS